MSKSAAFQRLHAFLTGKMRMSHIYQPLMLRVLIENGGRAPLRRIAAAFLAKDESQLEYYEAITKAMPAKVLSNHGLVARDGDGYRLRVDASALSSEERAALLTTCDEAVRGYLERRGEAAYDHRRQALGHVPGSVRYEVLQRAGFRCELCGISADERALEVDHILPRKHGGQDEFSNFQALCWKCNASKGARDAADLRALRVSLAVRKPDCIFCEQAPANIVASNGAAFAILDRYPVTNLHTLVIPRRHVADFFELYTSERRAIDRLLEDARTEILKLDSSVTGFNIGSNNGVAAGQTIFHYHAHLIARRPGDVDTPRGGVRGVIPGKADYGGAEGLLIHAAVGSGGGTGTPRGKRSGCAS
jgi:ATP adenylyltransferase